jgi:hypothetical protein
MYVKVKLLVQFDGNWLQIPFPKSPLAKAATPLAFRMPMSNGTEEVKHQPDTSSPAAIWE